MPAKILSLFLGLLVFSIPSVLNARDLLCSTFPVYLFTRNVVEGTTAYTPALMVESHLGCPHDYAPTPADLERLSQAEVLIMNGLGLDAFLARAVGVARNNLKIIDASGGFRANEEAEAAPIIMIDKKAVLDMGHGHHHHDGPNPHLFASPTTAARQVDNIAEGLAVLDPENASIYRTNARRYNARLTDLAASLKVAGEKMDNPKVIAGHGIFDYLARDLGLNIVATIEEEDGAEPSAARLATLIKRAREEGVRAVLVDPQGNIELARTLGAEAKLPVAVIDPVAAGPADAPLDYYEKVMLTDLDVLNQLFVANSSAKTDTPKK